jgi:predicted amidophosphoribosyltransferase
MICSSCQAANEADARFCEQCGQPLETRCPACGTLARPGARFCRQCGQSLAQPVPPSPPAAPQLLSPARTALLDDKLDRLQRYLP